MGAADIQITTSYPVLRGQTDATFEFSLDVANKSETDRDVQPGRPGPGEVGGQLQARLRAEADLQPADPGQQQPDRGRVGDARQDATAGEYPVLVRISSGESKAEAKLMVVLTGIYKLEAATPTGILSAEAVTGKPTTVSFVVKNTGSAVNRNVNLSAFKPENWKVEFKPEKLEALEPGAAQAGRGDHHARRDRPGGRLLGGPDGRRREGLQQDHRAAGDREGADGVGVDRRGPHRPGDRRHGRPVRLAGAAVRGPWHWQSKRTS